jgi:uncharacterized membrane protein YcjF (UPF0283 family)
MKMLGLGPMWFALALLVFSIIYALVRMVRLQTADNGVRQGAVSYTGLLTLVVIIATGAFLVRLEVFRMHSLGKRQKVAYSQSGCRLCRMAGNEMGRRAP